MCQSSNFRQRIQQRSISADKFQGDNKRRRYTKETDKILTVPSLITSCLQIPKDKCGTSSSDITESLQSSGNRKHHIHVVQKI